MKKLHHIVMFRLKDVAEGNTKAQNALIINDLLAALPSRIPEIKHYVHGINIIPSERAMDMALVSIFDNEEDLSKYINHPEHLKVVEFIKKVRIESFSCDFYTDD